MEEKETATSTDIDVKTHEFIIPKKEIKSPDEIASVWEKSLVSC